MLKAEQGVKGVSSPTDCYIATMVKGDYLQGGSRDCQQSSLSRWGVLVTCLSVSAPSIP